MTKLFITLCIYETLTIYINSSKKFLNLKCLGSALMFDNQAMYEISAWMWLQPELPFVW